MTKIIHESRVPTVSMLEEACRSAGILQSTRNVFVGGDTLITQWQNSPHPLSDEGYIELLESLAEPSKVITPISEESVLYECVGDETGCFDKEEVEIE